MIEREQAAKLYEVYQRAFEVLCGAYDVLGSLPDGPERDEAVLAHGEATDVVLFGLRARLLAAYPDLEARISEQLSGAVPDPLGDVVDEALALPCWKDCRRFDFAQSWSIYQESIRQRSERGSQPC